MPKTEADGYGEAVRFPPYWGLGERADYQGRGSRLVFGTIVSARTSREDLRAHVSRACS